MTEPYRPPDDTDRFFGTDSARSGDTGLLVSGIGKAVAWGVRAIWHGLRLLLRRPSRHP